MFKPQKKEKKEIFTIGRILLIFIGVLVLFPFAICLAPFVLIYMMYDRKISYKEALKGVKKKKEKMNILKSVNDWAN